MKRQTLKSLRAMAHEIGWRLTTSEPGYPKTFKYFVKKPNATIPCVDLEIASVSIMNEMKRRGYTDVWKHPMRD